jgi:hypothetical protein
LISAEQQSGLFASGPFFIAAAGVPSVFPFKPFTQALAAALLERGGEA